MRFHLAALTALFGATVSLASPVGNGTEPEITVTAAFPEDNPFGHVVNGEKNSLTVFVENKSDRNITLTSIGGSVVNPDTNQLIKNLSTLSYGIRLIENVTMQVPYSFYSEFKPGDLKLNIWLDHAADDEAYRVSAYEGIVTVVEPESSFFDYQVITTYLITTLFLLGLGYLSYITLFPSTSAKRSRKPRPSEPVGTVTATGPGGYQEEWIPEHHLKKPKAKRTKSGNVTSGDELSGAETSGAEGRKRKGKK